jgi:hypothetical protein
MSYFEKRYIEIDGNRITLAAKPGTIKKRYLQLAGAVAELDDPGAVKRGFTVTTGLIGRNHDKGTLFVTVTSGTQTETIEIPRKYGVDAREVVARINTLSK